MIFLEYIKQVRELYIYIEERRRMFLFSVLFYLLTGQQWWANRSGIGTHIQEKAIVKRKNEEWEKGGDDWQAFPVFCCMLWNDVQSIRSVWRSLIRHWRLPWIGTNSLKLRIVISNVFQKCINLRWLICYTRYWVARFWKFVENN